NVEFRTILSRDIYPETVLIKLGLSERQVDAVKFIKVGGRITNKEYQERFGLKKRQSTDDLKELENKGVLKREGTTGRGTYYILKGR
ncbi:MAG: transcriptional regulator, partial [Elusimicrobia bacterium]|nr:transcriptional regulator [Elusimicrobiota bacterium]